MRTAENLVDDANHPNVMSANANDFDPAMSANANDIDPAISSNKPLSHLSSPLPDTPQRGKGGKGGKGARYWHGIQWGVSLGTSI